MAIVGHRVIGFFLPGRFDVHLLPGDPSSDLFAGLAFDLEQIHDDRDPVPVSVRAELATTAPAGGVAPLERLSIFAAMRGSGVGVHHELGVTFEPATRVVTVDNPLPAGTRIQNFLVKAVATARNGAERTTVEAWVRVHVHERVERIWCTPNPMTVHPGSTRLPRLALFAEFDDGVVTDITRSGERIPVWDRRVTWTSDPATDTIATVDPRFGSILGGARGDARVTASFQPPGGGAPITDTATVRIAQPWNEGVDITMVSGDAGRRAHVPNILFVCEGFEDIAADRDAFDRLVHVVVDGLRRNHLVDPWPMLHASVNFWSAFTPGRQAGTTYRSEVYTKAANAQNAPFLDVPQPEAPKASNLAWTVAQLVHQIGLPVPADAATGITALLPQLRARFGDHITENAVKASFAEWRQLANRRLLNARDSALCFTVGVLPRAQIRPVRSCRSSVTTSSGSWTGTSTRCWVGCGTTGRSSAPTIGVRPAVTAAWCASSPVRSGGAPPPTTSS